MRRSLQIQIPLKGEYGRYSNKITLGNCLTDKTKSGYVNSNLTPVICDLGPTCDLPSLGQFSHPKHEVNKM